MYRGFRRLFPEICRGQIHRAAVCREWLLLAVALSVAVPVWSAPQNMDERKAVVFSRLIIEAERAVREGRLTTPSADNAYDKLQAARLLRPADPRVQAGLESIIASYEQRISRALERDLPEEADALLQRLERVAPDHSGVDRYRQQLAEVRASQPAQSAEPDQDGRVWLSPSALRARGPVIESVLQDLAQEVRRSNWSIHIYARNDEEGRWIYRQLKEAVPGYRIRGDIRISSVPYVQLLEPLT